MTFLLLWLISIIAAVVLADQKRQNPWLYLLIAFGTGPLAIIILFLVTSQKPIAPGFAKNQPGTLTPECMRRELLDLKSSVRLIHERIDHLEKMADGLAQSSTHEIKPQQDSSSTAVPMAQAVESVAVAKEIVKDDHPTKPMDLEMHFGRNWLSKIGIVVFTLGMVFLIGYTFKYFGPAIKILFGYIVSAAFFFFGKKLEQSQKFVNFGRVVWGGGWALAYFTTYAMHHFEASRLMDSASLNLSLLAMLVMALLLHVAKYRNEEMMAIAVCAAYVAVTMVQVTNFTLLSCVLLAAGIVFMVIQFQWIKTLMLGIVLTYGIHQLWVVPNMIVAGGQILFWAVTPIQYTQVLNLVFLSVYALMFLIASHMARPSKDSVLPDSLSAVNFGNIALYSIFAYPLVNTFFYDQRFMIVFSVGLLFLGLALLLKRNEHSRLYQSDLIAALFILTFAVPLKFASVASSLIWIIEIPFLLLIGLRFKERIYTYASYALTMYVGLQLFDFGNRGDIHFLGLMMTARDFVYCCAGVAMAVCFYLLRQKKALLTDADQVFNQIFSAAACWYWTIVLFSVIKKPWITLALSFEGALLLLVAVVLVSKRFRVYAYAALGLAFFFSILQDFYRVVPLVKWTIVLGNMGIFLAGYYALKFLSMRKDSLSIAQTEVKFFFVVTVALIIWSVVSCFPPQAIALVLGLWGVLFIILGIWGRNKTERWGGLTLLAMTLCRIIFVDISGLDVVFKIITFIVLGLLFLGASYVYNRFGLDK